MVGRLWFVVEVVGVMEVRRLMGIFVGVKEMLGNEGTKRRLRLMAPQMGMTSEVCESQDGQWAALGL